MGYYRRRYNRQPRQDNPELVARIEKTAARGVKTMTDWERNFLSSLLDSAKKWGRLSAKQHEVYQRIEKKLDPAHQAAVNNWRSSWTPDMREKAEFAANYYKANPPYFSEASERILNDPNHIPSEKLYRKMVENRYVQRAIENNNAAPKFCVGTMVTVRDSANVQGHIARLRGQLVMVISVDAEVKSATKGSRKVTILPIGDDKTIKTEERFLKKAKI